MLMRGIERGPFSAVEAVHGAAAMRTAERFAKFMVTDLQS